MSALGAPQLRRAFGALGGREARAVKGCARRCKRQFVGAIAGAVILGAIICSANFSAILLHASAVGGSVHTYSGENNMKITNSLSTVASTSAATLALAATFTCESANAQQAVQWRVEDGGNGHWYVAELLSQTGISWSAARSIAIARGADLLTFENAAERTWTWEHVISNASVWVGPVGPWLGGYQLPGSAEPSGGWVWVDGSDYDIAQLWSPDQPDNATYCGGDNTHLHYWGAIDGVGDTMDAPCLLGCGNLCFRYAAIEWSADCNSDGIVDYGQILSGQLTDTNTNGVPDICEVDPCPGDVIENGIVDSVDLAAMLGAWGTDGGVYPRADINHDGIVASSDLGTLLAAWGPCQ